MLNQILGTLLALTIVTAASAEITPNVVLYDVGPLQETGQEYVTYRVVIITSDIDDWTSAQISATVTDAAFYQDANNDGNPPDPNAFGAYPDSEFTSYYTSPEDYPNVSYTGGLIGFNAGPTETATTLSADWYDTITSADGTYVIAQLTVLPDGSTWSGQVDLTVYSTDNPAGVSGSFPISSNDYNPPVTATYMGPSGGTYNDPNHWDVGVVPLNVDLDRYNVILPDSTNVSFDIVGESQLSGLSLGSDSTFSFLDDENLLVRGTAVIAGILNASGTGAGFQAPSQFATFSGTRPQANVYAGALIRINAPTYARNLGDYRTSTTPLSADGAGSLLDLSGLDSLSVTTDGYGSYTRTVAGTNGGIVDLSNLTTATGSGSHGGADWLRFYVATAGDIDLFSLSQVSGNTWFDIDVPEYTLPALENVSSAHMDATDATTLNLPMLGSFNSGTFTVPNGGTINADQMTSFTWSTMSIADGGTVNAAALTNFTGSNVILNPSRALYAPPFTIFDHSQINLEGGATLAVAASSYLHARGDYRVSQTLLSADGAGSVLDLSSVLTLSVTTDGYGSYTRTVAGTNAGIVYLSNLTTATGPGDHGGSDWLRFLVATDGNIDLANLTTVNGNTWLDVDVPSYGLPSLTTFSGHLDLDLGTTLSVPVLSTIQGTDNLVTVPVFATFDAPSLASVDDSTINLSVGGTINAPNLTSFTNSTFAISQVVQGGPFLNIPPFANFDHSRLLLDGGAVFAVAAPSFTFNWGDYRSSFTILSAEGSGTLLDLSSVNSISVPMDAYGTYTRSISATNSGIIDLSDLSTASGTTGSHGGIDWLAFTTDTGGSILFGGLTATGHTRFDVDGTDSTLDFAGDLFLQSPGQLSVTLGATVNIAGAFSHSNTDESAMDTGGGVFHMNGSELQTLEVGGEDIGVPEGAVSGNFEIGQLIVGQTDQPTIVKLVDNIDNGNRPVDGVEGLYLQGFPGSDSGLRILGGSTLVIENIQLYVQELDEWVHINTLPDFLAGANCVDYDDGFICLSIVENDCNENGIDDRVDILLGNSEDCNENELPDECEIDVNSPAPGGPFYCTEDCDPDCNVNGIPDECDIADCDPNDPACQDCNENGVPDACDIAEGTSDDTNGNGIPDECEDCNNNGIPDYQDLADCDGSPWCDDCNANGILDWCDIDAGTSDDVDGNGIPDECEADCNGNGIPDAWDIATGTSEDCQPNGIPDECDLDPNDPDGNGEVSSDVNSNTIPDECEPDCNGNTIPDDWDIATGISQDCQPNGIPDECDVDPTDPDGDGHVSNDVNGNIIPDECEPDCQPNGVPDDWDIATGTSEDCNENGKPDECDIADGTSLDTDGNGVPDECQDCNDNGVLDWMDILNGTSEDCNGNMIPDECEESFEVYTWIGPDEGVFTDPDNWSPTGVPGGEAELINSDPNDNTCVLDVAGEKKVCLLTIGATGGGTQTLRINSGATLIPTGGTSLNAGGQIHLFVGASLDDGNLAAGDVTIASGGRLFGAGTVGASIDSSGTVESLGGELVLSGEAFTNQPTGELRATSARVVDVRSAVVTQLGLIDVRSNASMLFAMPLVNQANATITLLGGSLGAAGLTNDLSAEVYGFGTVESNTTNDGDMTFVADTQIIGDLLNNGTITIQNGTLSILGDFTNNGTIIGEFTSLRDDPNLPRAGGDGFFVQGDFVGGAGSSLRMVSADAVFRLGGNFDVAITDNTHYDMAAAELRMVGLGDEQALELMSRDIGANPLGLDRTQPGRYPLGTLHIGPMPTTVRLVDNHDNDGQGQGACEAAYVHTLQIDAGATLINPACRIYYVELIDNGTVTNPENLLPLGMFGDLNNDGKVDLADLGVLLANYGTTSGMSYEDGDLNGDGAVNLADLGALLAVYGSTRA